MDSLPPMPPMTASLGRGEQPNRSREEGEKKKGGVSTGSELSSTKIQLIINV